MPRTAPETDSTGGKSKKKSNKLINQYTTKEERQNQNT
jgi:hypothetical protein